MIENEERKEMEGKEDKMNVKKRNLKNDNLGMELIIIEREEYMMMGWEEI